GGSVVVPVHKRLVLGSGTELKLRSDPGAVGESVRHDTFICSSTSAAFGTLPAVEVARVRSVVGAAGAAVGRPAASISLSGSLPLSGPCLSGGNPVRALHRHPLARGPVSRARVAEW